MIQRTSRCEVATFVTPIKGATLLPQTRTIRKRKRLIRKRHRLGWKLEALVSSVSPGSAPRGRRARTLSQGEPRVWLEKQVRTVSATGWTPDRPQCWPALSQRTGRREKARGLETAVLSGSRPLPHHKACGPRCTDRPSQLGADPLTQQSTESDAPLHSRQSITEMWMFCLPV